MRTLLSVLLALTAAAASLAYVVQRDEDPLPPPSTQPDGKVVAHVHEHTNCSSHEEGPVDGYNPNALEHEMYEVSPAEKLAAELAGDDEDESECDSSSDSDEKDSDSHEKVKSNSEELSFENKESEFAASSEEVSDEDNLEYEFVFANNDSAEEAENSDSQSETSADQDKNDKDKAKTP